jgi:hypothetical protein
MLWSVPPSSQRDAPERIDLFDSTYYHVTVGERVVLFSFDQNDCYVGFTLLRYGDNWKIGNQVAHLVNTNALGTPAQTTVQEFENLMNK